MASLMANLLKKFLLSVTLKGKIDQYLTKFRATARWHLWLSVFFASLYLWLDSLPNATNDLYMCSLRCWWCDGRCTWCSIAPTPVSLKCCCPASFLSKEVWPHDPTALWTALAQGPRASQVPVVCADLPLPHRHCASLPCWDHPSSL